MLSLFLFWLPNCLLFYKLLVDAMLPKEKIGVNGKPVLFKMVLKFQEYDRSPKLISPAPFVYVMSISYSICPKKRILFD